jgi:hypothetical protein
MPATAATALIAAMDCFKLGTVFRFMVISVLLAGLQRPFAGTLKMATGCDGRITGI